MAFVEVILTALVIFFQFTTLGYRMTVKYHNVTEVQMKVYIDNSYSGDKDEVNVIISEAKDRVSDFWGNIKSLPTIIISDNKND